MGVPLGQGSRTRLGASRARLKGTWARLGARASKARHGAAWGLLRDSNGRGGERVWTRGGKKGLEASGGNDLTF